MNMTTPPNNNKPRGKMNRAPVDALPHPEIIEAYDCIVPGAAKQIMMMFEMEQKHRHEWERQALKTHATTTILGQIMGFLIVVSVFASATFIGLQGDKVIATFIWVVAMAVVIVAGIISFYARTMGNKSAFGRPTFRQQFRAEKEEGMEE